MFILLFLLHFFIESISSFVGFVSPKINCKKPDIHFRKKTLINKKTSIHEKRCCYSEKILIKRGVKRKRIENRSCHYSIKLVIFFSLEPKLKYKSNKKSCSKRSKNC